MFKYYSKRLFGKVRLKRHAVKAKKSGFLTHRYHVSHLETLCSAISNLVSAIAVEEIHPQSTFPQCCAKDIYLILIFIRTGGKLLFREKSENHHRM